MAILRPFCAIRPAKAYADSIAALPYDVYDRAGAKAAVKGKPLSFLRIDRAETQFPDEIDMYSPPVYEKAKTTLEEMLSNGFFLREDKPCYYIYALTMQGRTQNGLVGCASIDDYLDGTIKRHENTLPEKELDRICHIDTLNAQTGPIFLAYRPHAQLSEFIAAQKQRPPLYDFTSEDGVKHQVWKIAEEACIVRITQFIGEMNALYIADGHHRAASAVKVGLRRRKSHPDYDGTEEFNSFLSVLFSADELRIFPYNRIVSGADRYPPRVLLEKLAEAFYVEPLKEVCVKQENASSRKGFLARQDVSGLTRKKGEVAMYLDKTWYRLRARPRLFCGDPVQDLDVSILQGHVLEPLFDIHDPKTDSRISFIGGIQGADALMQIADASPGKIAFSMYPTSMEELLAVADEGRLMPPKSTWFEPKLRSGLFIHEL